MKQPEWVTRWTRARKAGDYRTFPEQSQVCPHPEPLNDRGVWIQPDEYLHPTTPDTPTDDMFDNIGRDIDFDT